MEEVKTTETTEEQTSQEPQEEKETSEGSENKEESKENAMVDAVMNLINTKMEGIMNEFANRFVALADDIHQRLDRQDDSLSTTAAQLSNRKEGVF